MAGPSARPLGAMVATGALVWCAVGCAELRETNDFAPEPSPSVDHGPRATLLGDHPADQAAFEAAAGGEFLALPLLEVRSGAVFVLVQGSPDPSAEEVPVDAERVVAAVWEFVPGQFDVVLVPNQFAMPTAYVRYTAEELEGAHGPRGAGLDSPPPLGDGAAPTLYEPGYCEPADEYGTRPCALPPLAMDYLEWYETFLPHCPSIAGQPAYRSLIHGTTEPGEPGVRASVTWFVGEFADPGPVVLNLTLDEGATTGDLTCAGPGTGAVQVEVEVPPQALEAEPAEPSGDTDAAAPGPFPGEPDPADQGSPSLGDFSDPMGPMIVDGPIAPAPTVLRYHRDGPIAWYVGTRECLDAMTPLMEPVFDQLPFNGADADMREAMSVLAGDPAADFVMHWLIETMYLDLAQVASVGDYVPRSLWLENGRRRLSQVCEVAGNYGD